MHVLPDLAETQGEHASPLLTAHLKLQLRQESENPTEHTFLLAGVPDDGNTQIDEPKFFNKQLEIEWQILEGAGLGFLFSGREKQEGCCCKHLKVLL